MVEVVSWLKDWGALVVAGLAVVLSGLAFRHTRIWQPRPLLVVEEHRVGGNDAQHTPVWSVRVANRGTGEALDVRLHSGVHEYTQDVLGKGELIYFHRELTPEIAGGKYDPLLDVDTRRQHGPVDVSGLSAKLTWRQAPHIQRIKSMDITP